MCDFCEVKENANTKLVAQVQYAKFLKETVQEMAQELKKSPSEELRRNASELESFMNKVDCTCVIVYHFILTFFRTKKHLKLCKKNF